MRRISLLDKKVFEKIAAGEIVEGPVSVVKELLENSLDAGADIIEIDTENAGMSLIRIIDNGSGIHEDDLEKAFLSHATSKIYNEEDLNNILTFGFRGEALASISAVSDTEIVSKTKDAITGSFLSISEGNIKEKGVKKNLDGTRIEIRNLFFNLPARKKFVSNLNLESSKITELISNYSLGHPEKDFILKRDNELIIDTRGYKGWEKRTSYILKSKKDNFFVIAEKNNNIKIEGVLFNPQISKNNRKSQIFFINGRLIKSNFLNNIVEETYEGLIGKGRFPMAVLNINLNPENIDVNIHPAKTEIRFLEERNLQEDILPILREALLKGLKEKNALSKIAVFKEEPIINLEGKEKYFLSETNKIYEAQRIEYLYEQEKDINRIKTPLEMIANKEIVKEDIVEKIEEETQIKETWLKDLRIIGQFKNTFILAEDEKDLYIIDQHVVHERVLYEKFVREANDNKIIRSTLISPIPLHLNPMEESTLIKNIIVLNNLGFEIENFGPQTYLLRTLPGTLEINNPEEFFADLLEDFEKNSINTPARIRDSVITNASCKKAIKANDKLSVEKIEYLLKELNETENPYTCPHGRPIFKKISINELYRHFQRGGYND